jgi:NAD(P)H-flavin reductase
MQPHPCRVLEVRNEIPGCTTLRVETAGELGDGGFDPGQFYMIYVFGHGEVPISVSGDPVKFGELTFTVMAVGSVTQALCAVQPGATIGLRGPFGSSWPVDQVKGRDVIVMAGGLGLAPLRPSIYHMLHNRHDYNDLMLLYGTREPSSIIFQRELVDWGDASPLEVDVTVDNAGREWPGKVGVVTELLKDRTIDAHKTSAFICGPEVMMRFSAFALLDRGVAAENIYVSMERNMQCAIKMCGRCQYGPFFICDDGPIFSFDRVERLFKIREV